MKTPLSDIDFEALCEQHGGLVSLIDNLVDAAEAHGASEARTPEFDETEVALNVAKQNVLLYINSKYEKSLSANIEDND